MCYASQQVIRKEFDYNAYIAGRLRGEYVVIYNTITEEPATVLPDDTTGKELVCIQDRYKNTPNLPDNLFLRPGTQITECCVGSKLTLFDRDLLHLYSRTKPFNMFDRTNSANCRGAPRCFS